MVGRQRFELENLRAADEWTVDGEERVLRRRPEEPDRAAFHVGQERVLLRAVEAVNLVDEEDRPRAFGLSAGGCRPRRSRAGCRSTVLSTPLNRSNFARVVMCAMTSARLVLPVPGGPWKMRGIQPVGLDGAAQEFARPEQMFLADVFIERARTHPRGERRLRIHGGFAR